MFPALLEGVSSIVLPVWADCVSATEASHPVAACIEVNLFDIPENRTMLRKMLGLESHKPTDCVGTVGEARLRSRCAAPRESAGSSPMTSMSRSYAPGQRRRSTTTRRLRTLDAPTRHASSSRLAPSSSNKLDRTKVTRPRHPA